LPICCEVYVEGKKKDRRGLTRNGMRLKWEGYRTKDRKKYMGGLIIYNNMQQNSENPITLIWAIMDLSTDCKKS
jgi:hypothetical protein